MVSFYSELTTLPGPKSIEIATDWLGKIINQNNKLLVRLSYVFCTDNYLLELNKKHLNHDTFTDVITFDNSEESTQVDADIFISLDRIKENAQTYDTSYQQELHRVMVHGLLHLLGQNDKTPVDKELMTQRENEALGLLNCFT